MKKERRVKTKLVKENAKMSKMEVREEIEWVSEIENKREREKKTQR